jgi:hypothetical protein
MFGGPKVNIAPRSAVDSLTISLVFTLIRINNLLREKQDSLFTFFQCEARMGRREVQMSKLMQVAAAVLALSTVAAPANAACVQFQETGSGDAYLINSCGLDMNAAYGVTGGSEWTPGDSALARVRVAAGSRKLLWSRGNAPVPGRYAVKVFGCVAPTSLVYPAGGRPTCQISYADAG